MASEYEWWFDEVRDFAVREARRRQAEKEKKEEITGAIASEDFAKKTPQEIGRFARRAALYFGCACGDHQRKYQQLFAAEIKQEEIDGGFSKDPYAKGYY